MNTVKEKWDSYLAHVVPDSAGPVQLQETENAFYAGAASMFGIMTNSISDMSEEAAMASMDGLKDEISTFVEETS